MNQKRTKILLEDRLVPGLIVEVQTIKIYQGKPGEEYKRYVVDVHDTQKDSKRG